MEKYQCIHEMGSGSYGTVFRAVHKPSGETVAVKMMRRCYDSWEECLSLREVKALLKLKNHPNIIRLKEIVLQNQQLFFIFGFMDCDLLQLMKQRRSLNQVFSESEIRHWCFQVFQGLAYMHEQGYFHRDLKPENLLVKGDKIKIADFGFARETNGQPPYTVYVMSRWFRAPEVLLQSNTYSSKVDMWSMGAIMAELYIFRPLFPGTSDADQMLKICKIIGPPTVECWSEGMDLARKLGYEFPKCGSMNFSLLLGTASKEAVSLIRSLCSWDPSKRPSAAEALQHPFFQSLR
ncbi:cyclin-dependent kinase F-4-like [Mercurialis annua]|uniref:cyclin-dependent kinase F-4-like n=1 Tax=Mercurialis annua TaxID=3986 RepID=UPI00215F641D|nr:cyclin-dependent kinase F-4-like [Mercurialis annua]